MNTTTPKGLYQLCPKCNGEKQIRGTGFNNLQYGHICPVCEGKGVISQLTGK